MFWSNENQDTAESLGQYLREELRLRLRVAADFATLGAYELTSLDEADELQDEAPVERVATEAPPKRVLLFAKVEPVCPHSAAVGPACRREAKRRPGTRVRGRQRAGSVRAPEQPCVCADGEPASA
jgi:hypothetical protein